MGSTAMQFEHISPELFPSYEGTFKMFEARDPQNMTWPWFNKVTYSNFTFFEDDVQLKPSTSNITIAYQGAAIPASPFRPQYKPHTPFVRDISKGLRLRTPLGQTKGADSRPGLIWTWNYFADKYNNSQFFVDSINVADVVMSNVTLIYDFSGLVRIFIVFHLCLCISACAFTARVRHRCRIAWLLRVLS